jgi:hypothetical protein
MDIYENGLYDELRVAAHRLEAWFSIDKIKPYSVYVWTKEPHDENVFDIFADHLQFYACDMPWEIPNEAIPIIEGIQKKLQAIEDFCCKKEER